MPHRSTHRKPVRRIRPTVDREKLRAAVRGLDRHGLLDVIDRALNAVPEARLLAVAGDRLAAAGLAPDSDFLGEVKTFCDASRRGDYYEDFKVNSKNCTEKSPGTERWIAECERLFNRSLKEAAQLGPEQTRKALELLLDLLRSVDEGNDNIVFWADEGGSYEVYVDWKKVMPLWFRSLAATSTPEDYADEAVRVIDDFVRHDRDIHLAQARAAASREQRAALKRC